MAAGFARCFALIHGRPGASPSGYNPTDLQAAYSLPSTTKGSGQTVAIVDAFDDPNADSAFISQPTWQTALGLPGCSTRIVADVAADADPNTGVSVYDTFHQSGWLVFGGTSVSSPIIASVYALAGNASTVNYGSYPYSHTSSLHDVTSGSNGSCSHACETR